MPTRECKRRSELHISEWRSGSSQMHWLASYDSLDVFSAITSAQEGLCSPSCGSSGVGDCEVDRGRADGEGS